MMTSERPQTYKNALRQNPTWHRQVGILVLFAVLLLTSTVTPVLAENPGHALSFNQAGEHVRLARTDIVMGGTAWTSTKTVSAWFKPVGATSPSVAPEAGQIIVGTDMVRWFGITRATFGGADRIWVWNSDGSSVARIPIEFTPDTWMHVALVHHNGILSAYKNGSLVNSIPSGPNSVPNNAFGTVFLGGSGRTDSRTYFVGQLDEVRLWNTALDQPTLDAWLNRELTEEHPAWAQLSAYYKMSDGSSIMLSDNRGNGRTGTLLGGMGNGNWVASGAFGWQPPEVPDPEPPVDNHPPVAHAQGIILDEDAAAAIALTGEDADDDPLTFRLITSPSHGVLSGEPPTLLYTPNANYNGPDGFTFVVNDGYVDSAAATVQLTVLAVNDPPVTLADSFTIGLEISNPLDVLANDYDVDGDALTIVAVGAAEYGATSTDGEIAYYTPHATFGTSDVFTYTIADPSGATADAQVTVQYQPQGTAGFALSFDGVNDFVRLWPTLHMMGPGWRDTKMVNLWVRPTGPAAVVTQGGPGWCDAIFGDRPRWWGISHCTLLGYDRIWVWNYDGNYDLIGVEYTTNEWTHITLAHAGGHLSAFVNGNFAGSMPSATTLQPSTGALPHLQIGGVINTASRNWTFQGEIDEVRLWSELLSEVAIQASMYVQLEGNEPGLRAYYRMSDGEGAQLTDNGPGGWHGSLFDGLPGFVPPNGPIEWVISGAFDQTAAARDDVGDQPSAGRVGNTVFLTIEGEPDMELEPILGPNRVYLPQLASD